MQVQPRTAVFALLAVLSGIFLTACGGGGSSGGGDAAIATSTALTYSYKTTSLVGSPSFALSPAITFSNTATGTVAFSSGTATDVVNYGLNTATGALAATSPYTSRGDLSQGLLMICKPAPSVDGFVTGSFNVGPTAIYVGVPATATPGSPDDLKGKTLDTYNDCAPSTSYVAFDTNGGGSFFNSSQQTGTAFTAANFAAFLTDTGVITRSGTLPNVTTDTDRLRVYKAGSKVIVVSRSVQTPASENTWGSLGVWVSR
jgi:hypothetical protein